MENTPLLLWWEIAFFLFPFENFTADLARPGSKSKLGFSVLLQHWLRIGLSHCFWNQPEKMSLCREQAEMSQKNRWAAWTIPWQQSRRGKGFSHCPPAPGPVQGTSLWLRAAGMEEPWCHHQPIQRQQQPRREGERADNECHWESVSCSWGSVCGKQRGDQRQQQLTDVWQCCSKGALVWWRQGREGGKDPKDQGGWSLFAGGWQEIFLQSQPTLKGMNWVKLLW